MSNPPPSKESVLQKYQARIWLKAKLETKEFWTAHRTSTLIASPILATVFWAMFRNWKSWTFLMQTVAISIFVFLALLGLTFLISCIRAPALVDGDSQTVIREMDAEIIRLQDKLRGKTELSRHAIELLIAGAESENFPYIRVEDNTQILFIMAGRLTVAPGDALNCAKYTEAVGELREGGYIDADGGRLKVKGLERAANEPRREQIFSELQQRPGVQ
jgi:hypothetical protein